MFLRRDTAKVLSLAITILAVAALPAHAAQMVTYSWTTTSEGFGPHVDAPKLATFQAPLSDVLAGKIPFSDITNVDLAYPGLTFDSSAVSSDGFDFAAYVDPGTGAFIYHDPNQGLGVIAFAGTDINSAITFLSITVDAVAHTPSGQLLTSVAVQYNALNDGSPFSRLPDHALDSGRRFSP